MSERAQHRRENAIAARGPWSQRNAGWLVAVIGVLAVGSLATFNALQDPLEQAPDIDMIAYQGQEVLGGSDTTLHALFERNTPIVVNFWASSCPPCRQEMPGFQRVMDEVGDAVLLIGVDIGSFTGLGSREGAQQFLLDYGIRYPAVFTIDDAPLRDYEVRSFPTTIFIDARGRITKKHTGYLSETQFRAELDALLATSR